MSLIFQGVKPSVEDEEEQLVKEEAQVEKDTSQDTSSSAQDQNGVDSKSRTQDAVEDAPEEDAPAKKVETRGQMLQRHKRVCTSISSLTHK